MRSNRGFTLIEVMVVSAIVVLLLSIAIPAYTEQMRKSRRSDALRALGDIQLTQERWRANHATYADNGADPATTIQLPTSIHYAFDVTVNNATAWTATATPILGGAQDGDRCGVYTFAVDNAARPGQPPLKTAGQPGSVCF